MHPTNLQRKALGQYRAYHDNAPTLGNVLGRASRRYLALLIVALVTVIFITLESDWSTALPGAALLGGLIAGVALRDFGNARILIKIWPALVQVMDWQQIDRLLGQPNQPDGTHPDDL